MPSFKQYSLLVNKNVGQAVPAQPNPVKPLVSDSDRLPVHPASPSEPAIPERQIAEASGSPAAFATDGAADEDADRNPRQDDSTKPATSDIKAEIPEANTVQADSRHSLRSDEPQPEENHDAAAGTQWHLGMTVRVKGLKGRSDLNGTIGVLSRLDAEKHRWQVELRGHGGPKLFKFGNLEAFSDERDALESLRDRTTMSRSSPPEGDHHNNPLGVEKNSVVGPGPNVAILGCKPQAVVEQTARKIFPQEQDDEAAFIKSIEQCLKECDVMWDDY